MEEKESISRTILTQLQEWFGPPDSTKEYIQNSKDMPFWACFEKDKHITNAFYETLGFREFECFPTLWDEWNPCQVYVKYIEKR